MRAVLQRVRQAHVTIEGAVVGGIDMGLVMLLCVMDGDTRGDLDYLVRKILSLRLFEGEGGKFDLSAIEVGAEVLLVSQFTLAARTKKGRRPDFTAAAPPTLAEPMCKQMATALREAGLVVAEGRFGARMEVTLVNEGPVTLWLDSRE